MDMAPAELVYVASTWVVPVLFAITMHEAAHAFVAWQRGDDTAYNLGRVTFNPIKHIDPFGTVILPALLLVTKAPFLFGWAKPVPVSYQKLRNPRGDMVIVAAAGPVANVVLAVASAVLLHGLWLMPDQAMPWSNQMLNNSIRLNLVLAIFNMLPLPPLDGGRIAVGLLPDFLAWPLARLERYGLLILIGVIFLLPYAGDLLGIDLDVFTWIVWRPVEWLLPFFDRIAGVGWLGS
jgi:Zn-dependent protease